VERATRGAKQKGDTAMMSFYGFGGWGFVVMVLVWLVIVGLAIWVLSVLFPRTGTRARGPTARDILDERLARGEISREEYEQMRHDLAT
jgi:putative membrane protein